MGKKCYKRRLKKRFRNTNFITKRSYMVRCIRKHFSWFSYGLVGFITASTLLILMFVLTGCGHTITHTDRGTGFMARIPLPDGSSLIDLKIGKIDSTTTVLRGNSTYDSSASTGGSVFGSASTSDRTFVATGVQLNEGYLADVLTSKDVDPQTKLVLTQALIKVQAAKPKATVTKSVGAVTASGDNPQTEAEPVAVGIDNAVNKVTAVAPKVVVPIAHATKEAVKDVSTAADRISDDWKMNVVVVAVAVIIGLLIVAGVFILILRIKRKKIESSSSVVDKTDTVNVKGPKDV